MSIFSHFEFKGMSPTVSQQEACDHELQALIGEAPYDSQVHAVVEKISNGYWASVEVRSHHRPFVGKAYSPHAVSAASDAIGLVRRRMNEWKRNRGPTTPSTPAMPLHGRELTA
jgi:hypothetical protein